MTTNSIGIPGDTLSGNVSGIGNYLLGVLQHGGFDGFDTVVYLKGDSRVSPDLNGAIVRSVPPILPRRGIPESLRQTWWENISVDKAAEKDDVDLYFAPNYLQPVRYSGKSVIVVHDLIHEVCPQYLPKSYVIYMQLLLPRSVRRADRVITVSQSTKSDLIEAYGTPASKIDVAYGAASDQFDRSALDESQTKAVRSSYGLDDKYVLYVGNLEPRKNVHTIIDAVEQLDPELRPDVAIAGQEFQSYPKLRSVYESCEIQDQVHFLGYVEFEDLPHLYAGAELFVFPSFYEGFGLPLVEAMKAGTPVVTSDRSSLPEVVGDAGITVDPNSSAELAAAIGRVLDSDSVRWREEAFARSATFTWNETASTINDVLTEVLE